MTNAFDGQTGVDVHFGSFIYGQFGHSESHRSVLDHFFCKFDSSPIGGVSVGVLFHRIISDSYLEGLMSVNNSSREYQLFCQMKRNQTRQTLSSAF